MFVYCWLIKTVPERVIKIHFDVAVLKMFFAPVIMLLNKQSFIISCKTSHVNVPKKVSSPQRRRHLKLSSFIYVRFNISTIIHADERPSVRILWPFFHSHCSSVLLKLYQSATQKKILAIFTTICPMTSQLSLYDQLVGEALWASIFKSIAWWCP